jgi:hypothetical protein
MKPMHELINGCPPVIGSTVNLAIGSTLCKQTAKD